MYYIKNTKQKTNDNTYIIKKKEFYVPKIDEFNKLLYKFHANTIHSNYKEMKNQFKKKNMVTWLRIFIRRISE